MPSRRFPEDHCYCHSPCDGQTYEYGVDLAMKTEQLLEHSFTLQCDSHGNTSRRTCIVCAATCYLHEPQKVGIYGHIIPDPPLNHQPRGDTQCRITCARLYACTRLKPPFVFSRRSFWQHSN